MSDIFNIGENEIRVAGSKRHKNKKNNNIKRWLVIALGVVAVIAVLFFVAKRIHNGADRDNLQDSDVWFNNTNQAQPSCTVVSDTVIDSLHLRIITPYNAVAELHVGELDSSDADIVCATLAADVRRDNGKIVGAFVLAGEPLSWGLSKRGYCAISDRGINVGVAENSPLFEQATEQGGSFFRHYPAVDNGRMVENNPENLSFRRAICTLGGRVCIVVCTDRVLMNDFSTALVKLGVGNAIFLVGGTADGWYRTVDGTMHRLGRKTVKESRYNNYLVFRAQ